MRIRVKAAAFIFFLSLSSLVLLPAQSVKLVRTINFLDSAKQKKSLKTFIFGRKKRKAVKPCAICRVNAEFICVTDSVNGAVLLIDKQGKIKKRITRVKGINFLAPVSACIDDRGSLYVADSAQGGVIRFNSNFRFEEVFIASLDRRITAISFAQGHFYCVDTQNHQVLCFDRLGQLKFSFGKRGISEGEFNFPTHIATDKKHIYITDAMNFRVQVFDFNGRFIRVFGSHGRGGGNFAKPKGIAVDSKGHIFAADAMFDNVQIFDKNGEFLYFFGGPGQQENRFWMPSGIMVDHDDTIWVADTYNHRLQIFRLVEETI
ncbi:MAG: 6-bladed beta-propeller [Candidatus Aminicenantes bacterium]|nr:6-bladed beta-propeller [Candidatus Aminicenantes bacterium]